MPGQMFFQAKLLGINRFLSAPTLLAGNSGFSAKDSDLLALGRCRYVSLLGEVLPRVLLQHLKLSPLLLGESGGGSFLLLLPEAEAESADNFLLEASAGIHQLSGGLLHLTWGLTENIGAWSDVRRRIEEAVKQQQGTPGVDASTFEPIDSSTMPTLAPNDPYFLELGTALEEAAQVSYDPGLPGQIRARSGVYSYLLNSDQGVPLVKRLVEKSAKQLGEQSPGAKAWGVIRGEIDHADIRQRRAESVEDHLQTSTMFKNFLSGELAVVLSREEFAGQVGILFSGIDGFAVFGAWDKLIAFARELQRLFQRFSDAHLKDLSGIEGKTMSMSLALASADEPLTVVYGRASQGLNEAKAAGRDRFHLLGRAIDWKEVGQAASLSDDLVKIVRNHKLPIALLYELGRFYRDQPATAQRRGKLERMERPWRFYRRIGALFSDARGRKMEQVQANVISDFIGKNTAQARLRPAGRVALEWANLVLAGR
jgi:CRISPR-associated protein Csm1